MLIMSGLKDLEEFIAEERKRGRKMTDLYESVQQASGLLQRMYLMVVAGAALIESRETAAKEILVDLHEMARGVQTPQHGLLLRYFMLKKLKDKLPDKGSSFEGYLSAGTLLSDGGDVADCINFLLLNLNEMNKLWIRMQSTGAKDKSRREAQRNDLNMVVGENLVRLSSLAGVNLEMYSNVVLPKLLELIISCKDTISQQYLMDSIIQVFTDEFHLKNLEKLLEALVSLNPSVDNKALFVTLMERLANYAAIETAEVILVDQESNIFLVMKKYIDKLLDDQGNPSDLVKILDLQVAFCRFSIRSYPKKIDYVNQIFESTAKVMQTVPVKSLTPSCLTSVGKLLTLPLETLALEVLNIPYYPTIMQYLNTTTQREVATKILNVALPRI